MFFWFLLQVINNFAGQDIWQEDITMLWMVSLDARLMVSREKELYKKQLTYDL